MCVAEGALSSADARTIYCSAAAVILAAVEYADDECTGVSHSCRGQRAHCTREA